MIQLLKRYGIDAASGPTVLLQDTFTDSNGTSLDAHTMDVGSGWTEVAQDWEIQSNEATYTGASDGAAVATAEAGQADAKVTQTITLHDPSPGFGRANGTIGRYTTIDDYWLVAPNQEGDTIKVYEKNSGSFTERASSSVTLESGVAYELVATFDGTTITGTIEGVEASYGSASFNQSATTVGLRGFRDEAVILTNHDDFEVTAL